MRSVLGGCVDGVPGHVADPKSSPQAALTGPNGGGKSVHEDRRFYAVLGGSLSSHATPRARVSIFRWVCTDWRMSSSTMAPPPGPRALVQALPRRGRGPT